MKHALLLFCTITLIIVVALLFIDQNIDNLVKKHPVVVVGGGLAGCVTTLDLAENGKQVILMEKYSILGGNSLKASSGINFVKSTEEQESLYTDMLKSAKTTSEHTLGLIQKMVKDAHKARLWLEKHDLKFDTVVKLGGHSEARTYRWNKYHSVGYRLMTRLSLLIHQHPLIEVLTNCELLSIHADSTDASLIDSVKYRDKVSKENKTMYLEQASLVLTSGGFSANQDLLPQDLRTFPTTNSKFTDGIVIEQAVLAGALTQDVESIQLNPTAFVDINNTKQPYKYSAAEILRGEGAILLNDKFERFCDELGTRDYIIHEMNEQNHTVPHFMMVIPPTSKLHKHCSFYTEKNLIQFFKEIPPRLKHVLQNSLSFNDGGYIGIVTPAVHYTNGGLMINEQCLVIGKENKPFQNLWAAGECTGGIHGRNRLGGNSLLECLVFGLHISQQLYTNKYDSYRLI
jgi:FAD-dependent fumarate reductase